MAAKKKTKKKKVVKPVATFDVAPVDEPIGRDVSFYKWR